ncbi:hypothetical protein KIH74_14015 [Kineosporia sp. J2-2]|uniref:Nucleoside diphosphate kinase n=1 Tax=Kineosporia corallincola TaxID=2835133 RepID=A0ABS5TG74_9ACTN|nr:nucleoside-diphosphate kinase [Kineosporia corallincola]MBT0770050.1 hypothetical protein [Kineosporia corallincola]
MTPATQTTTQTTTRTVARPPAGQELDEMPDELPDDGLSDVDVAELRTLTRDREKAAQYRIDPHYRRGRQLIEPGDVWNTTFVVLKPDALAGRRVEAALRTVRGNGFTVVAATTLRFTPLLTREVWRYQFNIASRDRADVVDLLLPCADSLLLVLRDTRWCPGSALPAACRLAALKGPADPAARGPADLRTALRGPTTLFNFLHTADEPADVVRELALFDLVTPRPVTPAVGAGEPLPDQRVEELVSLLYQQVPAHDLDAAASRERLAAIRHPAVREGAGWRALLDALTAGELPADALWDVLSVATAAIECNVPGLRPVIPTVGAERWTREDGR